MYRTWKKTTDEGVEEGEYDVDWDWIRKHRNQFLEETDWRFMSDQSPSDEWISFRKKLRDLPQDFPDSANDACDNFPVMPDE